VIETIPGQAMLKCSHPSQIMPLHHLCNATYFLSPVLLYQQCITHFYFGDFLSERDYVTLGSLVS